jgi:ATP-binding cassette subfamily B (MDR/TAP) protein 1
MATMLGGLCVALIYCWKIGLVVLAACPAVAIGGALQMKLMTGFSQSKEFENSAKFAGQAMEHIRFPFRPPRLDRMFVA